MSKKQEEREPANRRESRKKPAIAVAAALTSVGATAEAQTPVESDGNFNPFGAREHVSSDPLLGPTGPARKRGVSEPPRRGEPDPEYPELDRMVQPFGFLGANVSWVTSYYGEIYLYPYLPRIAPNVGLGLRIKPDADFSGQVELALDFVGGSYVYPPFAYVYAATYLSLPLLARHRIGKGIKSVQHFTWGLQFSQLIGESYNYTLLGFPIGVYNYNYGGYTTFNPQTLSASIGFQTRKRKNPYKWSSEFEMRFTVGLTSFGAERNGTSAFTFRWNLVPPASR